MIRVREINKAFAANNIECFLDWVETYVYQDFTHAFYWVSDSKKLTADELKFIFNAPGMIEIAQRNVQVKRSLTRTAEDTDNIPDETEAIVKDLSNYTTIMIEDDELVIDEDDLEIDEDDLEIDEPEDATDLEYSEWVALIKPGMSHTEYRNVSSNFFNDIDQVADPVKKKEHLAKNKMRLTKAGIVKVA